MTIAFDLSSLTPLDYTTGYLVKATATHRIEIWRMLVNWRVVTTPIDAPGWPERGWCYFGLGAQTFTRAVLAAHAWEGADGTEPAGYDRRVP